MAEIKFNPLFKNISGNIGGKKQKIVVQTKRHKVGDGTYIEGRHELCVRTPRDYKKAPTRAGEQVQIDKFSKACAYMRTWWNADKKRMAESPDFQYWYARWQRQTKKAEADAPIDKTTGLPKRYVDFRAFVRAKYMAGQRPPVSASD